MVWAGLNPLAGAPCPIPCCSRKGNKTFSSASGLLGRKKQFKNAGNGENSFPIHISFLFPLCYPSSLILRGRFQLFPSSAELKLA